jgi:hypothetical protein
MTAEALRPNASDETPHLRETTPLWNESWYFDFVDPQRRIGGWVRLGLMPNEGVTWISALVCGPDIATVAVLDFEAALPTNPGRVRTDTVDLTLDALNPLQQYAVAMRGHGRAHDDPAALLRGEAGDGADVELAMDLSWTTAGVPYQYRLTSRYEIPCTVSGSITVGGTHIELNDVPGQRDHSWGARDWWGGMEWMWCALHLDDGTHLHAVDGRVPGLPNMGIGYIQQPGLKLIELQMVSVHEAFAANGLPVSATISLEPGGLTATVDFGGHAPIRLVSASGQVSHFPRAWVGVTTNDGRTGVGWIEWNRMPTA